MPKDSRSWWQKKMDAANSARAEWRDALAFWIANPGEGSPDDRQALRTHEGFMRGEARNLGEHMTPEATAALLDTVGIGNEVLSGSLAYLGGRGFYGPKGYDQEDIDANRRGIEQGVSQAEKEREKRANRYVAEMLSARYGGGLRSR